MSYVGFSLLTIGPYEGVIRFPYEDGKDSGYAFDINGLLNKSPIVTHFIEAKDSNYSNYMRYANCSSSEDSGNCVAFQHGQEVYYRLTKPVEPKQEIFVWYGNEYAKFLGDSLVKTDGKNGNGKRKRDDDDAPSTSKKPASHQAKKPASHPYSLRPKCLSQQPE